MDTTAAKRIVKDFQAFLSDYGKVAKRLACSVDPEEIVGLLNSALSDDALRLVVFCCERDAKRQICAVIMDDVGSKAKTEFRKLERVVAQIVQTRSLAALADVYRRRTNGKGLIPDKNVPDQFTIDCGVILSSGEPVGRLTLIEAGRELYTLQQSLPDMTLTAARFVDCIDDAYIALHNMGVDPSRLQGFGQQRRAFALLLRVVKATCQRLGIDWEELLKECDTDEASG